ncbi:hypothetical protein P7L87_26745 [Vibrio parahaemolyticus]|uniref:Uncharacterized protein n=1 Tax=Microvirga mediterraneensis TaxID=2754695 RepID=A0A838BPA5_9HYPH|nr:hypothetical protein [Microvirga mediterraneensis]MBA1157230.1 hypothetical protein [Microvirga mediterraneensis]MDG2571156.1 hypothetical protein [Vibrio parahaemolyticus]
MAKNLSNAPTAKPDSPSLAKKGSFDITEFSGPSLAKKGSFDITEFSSPSLAKKGSFDITEFNSHNLDSTTETTFNFKADDLIFI